MPTEPPIGEIRNKTDHAASVTEARALVREIRPEALLIEARHAVISDELLRFPVAPRSRFHVDTASGHTFPTSHFIPSGAFDRERLRAVLSGLPPSVLRVKGYCRLGPEAAPHLLQFASGQWTLSPGDAHASGLVVIGTPEMPDRDALAALLNGALVGHCL